MTQIVEDLVFQIHFDTVTLANLIKLVDNITQVRAYLLNFSKALAYAICDHGFTLAWMAELESSASDFVIWEYYYRSRLIQDYVSGMTDLYAWDEYRRLMAVE